MKVLISGSRGMIGSELFDRLQKDGDQPVRLSRRSGQKNSEDVIWDPAAGEISTEDLKGFDAIVHLAGEDITDGRWTNEKKDRIRSSRVEGTKLLANTVAKLKKKPSVFISASAIGFYGDRGEEVLTEESSPGSDFLAQVCRDSEEKVIPVEEAEIRTVVFRIGVVLSPKAKALKRMVDSFQKGLGAVAGSGKQFISWVSMIDAIEVIRLALRNPNYSGIINLSSPNPVRNEEFAHTVGKAMNVKVNGSVPKFLLRTMFGELADAIILSSTRVEPKRLKNLDYEFQHPELKTALSALLPPNES